VPTAFRWPEATVRAITAERTFWEKATLLHALAHQDTEKIHEARPARHLYDIHRLWQHGVGRQAVGDVKLLADVVRHKRTFYCQASAKYELAVPGSFRLVPGENAVRAIQPEYAQMAEEMIFGEAPDLAVVLETLRAIEGEINGRS
jgi:hypothetical protein